MKKLQDLMMPILLGLSIIVFIAICYVGLSKLSTKSNQLVSLKLQSRVAANQLSSLAAAKKQVQKYSYFNDVVKTVIPTDKNQAQAVLDIFQMAASSGIALQDISFPASNLGGRSSATSAAGASSSSPSSTDTSSSSAISQAKAVPGIPGLYSLQLTVTPQNGAQVPASVATTYPKLLDFLNRIEHDRRTAQISEVDVQPQPNSNYIGFTLIINIFIKP